MLMDGTHDLGLVALSVLIAVLASYTSLDLASRVPRSAGAVRAGWLAAAAIVLGGGIWSMHFVAMLAHHMGVPIAYDLQMTILSFVIAVAATGVALVSVSRGRATPRLVFLAGAFMGVAIVGMHYTGMSAMRFNGVIVNQPAYVAAAALIAVVASCAAILLAFRHHSMWENVAASVALGLGISGMHYIGIAGASFVSNDPTLPHAVEGIIDRFDLVVAVTAATFTIFAAALLAAMYDRRFSLLIEREAAISREGEERYLNLYQRTPLPLHSLNAQGRIEQVSDRWLDLLGYRRSEVIGRPLTDFMTPDSARRRDEEYWPRLLGTGELREAEYRLLTRDGRQLDCVLSAVAERDREGRVTKTLCGLIDITERRQTEEALRQAQKLEAVGQLTGGIAHDFNNLLAVVLGNLELARKRAPADTRLIALIDNTIQAAQRGAALTQRMLAFARRQDLKPEPVDIPDLVMGMAELLRRSIGPSIRIETRFPLGLKPARVDANQFELALLNLAVNARDAMPGGGSIIIGAREEVIAEDDEPLTSGRLRAGAYLCLTVTDTGSGMDEETLARAAEPFFTTKGVGKGTGLGLAMVHGLAAQSGGHLILSSKPGEGTTATIYLPLADEGHGANANAELAPATELDGGGVRVLVVDDDPLVLSSTGAMLEDLGYVVTEATSAEEALSLLDRGLTFDVVLTDQAMPGMTGVQLAGIIRSRLPKLPVILGTGYAELPPDAIAGLERLGKPFSRDALHRVISRAARVHHDNVVPLPSRTG